MKRLVIGICFLMVSCNTIDKPEKPENLLSEDEMATIIFDMVLLSSAKGSNKIILEANKVLPEDYVYKKHNIDSLQFASSNAYYASDIDTYEKIYNKVHDSLEKAKKYYKKIEDEELEAKRKSDSIRRANKTGKIIDSTMVDSMLKKAKRKRPKLTRPLVKKSDSIL